MDAASRRRSTAPVDGFERILPEGETVLWTGAPDAMTWLRRSWALRGVWLWVGAVALFSAVQRGGIVVPELTWIFLVGVVGTLFVAGAVLWTTRATRYLVTDRRVAMAIGLALPGEANIPLIDLENAAVRRYGDGSGDIALRPKRPVGAGYLILWPHVRPWRIGHPEPTLRALSDVDAVASALKSAVDRVTDVPVDAETPDPRLGQVA